MNYSNCNSLLIQNCYNFYLTSSNVNLICFLVLITYSNKSFYNKIFYITSIYYDSYYCYYEQSDIYLIIRSTYYSTFIPLNYLTLYIELRLYIDLLQSKCISSLYVSCYIRFLLYVLYCFLYNLLLSSYTLLSPLYCYIISLYNDLAYLSSYCNFRNDYNNPFIEPVIYYNTSI